MSSTTPATRTVKEAKNWTKRWQDNNKSHAKAFLVPIGDLIACFNEMNVKFTTDANGKIQAVSQGHEVNIRAYLGTDDKSPSEDHLLLVGTTTTDGVNYKDMVETAAGVSQVYDFTKPCPSNCDPGSELNHKATAIFSK
nr:hypothetical protein [uncultured Psychroserpens sp.]